MDTKIKLKNVRLAFPRLFKPGSFDNGPAKFSATFIMPRNHPQIKEIIALVREVAKAKWGSRADAELNALERTNRSLLQDGVVKPKYPEFEGNFFLNASNAAKPAVVDRNPNRAITEQEGIIYAGCYVNTNIDIWAMDKVKYGKRICVTLLGVQFYKDGDPFAGTPPSNPEDFDNYEESEDAPFGNDDYDPIYGGRVAANG